MSRRQRTVARIAFILYVGAVAWLCFGRFDSLPDAPRSLWGIPMDKIAHFLMFLPFPVLAFLSSGHLSETPRSSVLRMLGFFFAGCLFAAATELIQARFLPYRSGDPADFRADLAALGIGSLFILVTDLWKQRK